MGYPVIVGFQVYLTLLFVPAPASHDKSRVQDLFAHRFTLLVTSAREEWRGKNQRDVL